VTVASPTAAATHLSEAHQCLAHGYPFPQWRHQQLCRNEAEKKAKPKIRQIQNGNKWIREPERKKSKTNCLAYFWVFAGDGDSHRRHRKTEGKKTFQIPWFFGVSSCSRAASGVARGETCCHCSCSCRRPSLQFLEF